MLIFLFKEQPHGFQNPGHGISGNVKMTAVRLRSLIHLRCVVALAYAGRSEITETPTPTISSLSTRLNMKSAQTGLILGSERSTTARFPRSEITCCIREDGEGMDYTYAERRLYYFQ